MPLDNALETCQTGDITVVVPTIQEPAPCAANGGDPPKTSKRGGPRPGFGGPQPGSGRPRKVITRPTYAPDALLWRVVSFWGQAEVSATTELTRLGYETYLPLVAIRRRDRVVKTMWHPVRVPYLPGYGFIRLAQNQPRIPILETRGVREVLKRPDGRLSSVADAEIERMQVWDERRLQLPKEHAPCLSAGCSVHIEDGPFAGHPGIVVQCDGMKTQVAAQIFGRSTPIWLDRVSVSEIV